VGTLYLVSTPIGNLEDLTARAARLLRGADRILAEDTRRTRILADEVESDAPLVSLHEHNEAGRTEQVLGWLAAGEELVLVSDAGTPLVSDPGARTVAAVAEAGHRVVPIPGPSAVLAALVASGLPSETFAFLGFPAKKGGERTTLLNRIATSDETVVLFESPHRLVGLLEDLESLCGEEREVAVARELTKVHEEFIRGTLAEARRYYETHPAKGEVTVVVAPRDNVPVDPGVLEEDARALARQAFHIFLDARHEVELFDGALEILDILSRDYVLGALTNGNADIRRLEVSRFFDFGYSSASVGVSKPAPEMFRAALAHARSHPEEAVHVGDHLLDDIEGASGVGMHTIWVNLDRITPSEDAATPSHVVHDLVDVPRRIRLLHDD
jgi:16S rRNA (cytidine1402-2'-O)-methyltransferase